MPRMQDLCEAFDIKPRTVWKYVQVGIIDPPTPRGGRHATYPPDSYTRIRAAREIVHDGRVTLVDLAQRPYWWRQQRPT